MFSVALPGKALKAMIVNQVSLVNELVNGLNGQLKMVNEIKQITTSRLVPLFKPFTFRVKKKNVKKIMWKWSNRNQANFLWSFLKLLRDIRLERLVSQSAGTI